MKHLRRRAEIVRRIRRFFDDAGYLEVDTPVLVRSPGVELHLDVFRVRRAGPTDESPTQRDVRYLNTSPEYHMKRLLAAGSGPIWQMAKVFRAGELGPRHSPEFSMLEWYRLGFDQAAAIEETAALLASCGVVEDPSAISVLTVGDALTRFASTNLQGLPSADDPERIDRLSWLMATEVEPALAKLDTPLVALIDYPADMASLARLSPDDPTVARRFELYAHGVELANGFEELTDPAEQRARMASERHQRAAAGKPELPYDERFLDALADLPPCTGVALGVDRLVMLATGARELSETQAFPASEA